MKSFKFENVYDNNVCSFRRMHPWTWIHNLRCHAVRSHVYIDNEYQILYMHFVFAYCNIYCYFSYPFADLNQHTHTHMHICAQQTSHWYPFQCDDCYFYHDLVFSFAAFHFVACISKFPSQFQRKTPKLYHISFLCECRNMSACKTISMFLLLATQWNASAFYADNSFLSIGACTHSFSFAENTQQKENFSIDSQNVTNRGLLKVDKRDCQKSFHFHSHSLTQNSFQLHSIVCCVSLVPFSAENCCISIGLLNWFFFVNFLLHNHCILNALLSKLGLLPRNYKYNACDQKLKEL